VNLWQLIKILIPNNFSISGVFNLLFLFEKTSNIQSILQVAGVIFVFAFKRFLINIGV